MKNHLVLSLAFIMAIFVSSCNKSTVPPVASFTHVDKTDTITFTNTSTDATSYSWNFGDNKTSTEKDPVHIFGATGNYTVVLTATNDDGSNTYSETISIVKPPIAVDGNFQDWSLLPSNKLFESSVTDTAALKGIKNLKVSFDDNYLYFYIKLDTANVGTLDFYLNTDNVATTGSNSWLWNVCGGDYLIEGFLNVDMTDAAVFNFPATEKDQSAWAWVATTPAGSGVVTLSKAKLVSGTTVEIEGKIVRELVAKDWASSIGIGIFTQTHDWSIAGCLPGGGNKFDLLQVKLK